jgi:hypothetical protein
MNSSSAFGGIKMGHAVKFPGANRFFRPPPGNEHNVDGAHVFQNGTYTVMCWELSKEEIEEVVKTGKIYCSQMAGSMVIPVYVGSEQSTRDLIADHGVWKR